MRSAQWLRHLATTSIIILFIELGTHVAIAQVPIAGWTGTMALEGNVDKIYTDLNTVIVKTIDGKNHVVRVVKGTPVHGATGFDRLDVGTPVVVHYTMTGNEKTATEIDQVGPSGLKHAEGVVTRIDQVRHTITVTFADGTRQTLKLTHHAVNESNANTTSGNRVLVYYSDENGEKVAHYFKVLHR